MARPALGHILQHSQQGLTVAQFRQNTIPVFHLILFPELTLFSRYYTMAGKLIFDSEVKKHRKLNSAPFHASCKVEIEIPN
jgi:hypothetical protein